MKSKYEGFEEESGFIQTRQARYYWTITKVLAVVVVISLLICISSITVSIVALSKADMAYENTLPNKQATPCKQTLKGKFGIVAANHPLAAKAGMNILEAGGNAFDAAAAVQFMLNVVEPHMSGIGGGVFILMHEGATGKISALDGREEAPAAVTPNYYCKDQSDPKCASGTIAYEEAVTGGLPVGVPGTLHAFNRLLNEHGTIPLSKAMDEAIEVAENGFAFTLPMYQNAENQKSRLSQFPDTKKFLYNADGSSRKVGDIVTNVDLANTFRLLQEHGIGIFYNGSLATEISETVKKTINPVTNRSGTMEVSDLSSYKSVYRTPTNINYRGYDVFGMSGPSSGGPTLAMILNMFEGIDFSSITPFSIDHVHRMAEAQNIAFADRNQYMGDPDFADVPLVGLMNKDYARSRRAMMGLFNAIKTPVNSGVPPGAEAPFDQQTMTPPENGTSHFIVADKWGNIASVTTTIELQYGSGIIVPGRGFFLNNELTDFDFIGYDGNGTVRPNAPEGRRAQRRTAVGADQYTIGGKRPRSSMTPTIVLRNEKPFMAVGCSGGSFIIGYVLNPLHKVLDYGMCLPDAIASPDIVSRNGAMSLNPDDPTWTNYTALQAALVARGFETPVPFIGGNNHAILIHPDGEYEGSPNPRLVTSAVEVL